MRLLPISNRFREILAAIGRGNCPDICLTIMSEGDEWKRYSDVYYTLVAHIRLPWATYSKLTKYLIEKGFIESQTRKDNKRKVILVRLTNKGKELVKMYVELQGRKLQELELKNEPPLK